MSTWSVPPLVQHKHNNYVWKWGKGGCPGLPQLLVHIWLPCVKFSTQIQPLCTNPVGNGAVLGTAGSQHMVNHLSSQWLHSSIYSSAQDDADTWDVICLLCEFWESNPLLVVISFWGLSESLIEGLPLEGIYVHSKACNFLIWKQEPNLALLVVLQQYGGSEHSMRFFPPGLGLVFSAIFPQN